MPVIVHGFICTFRILNSLLIPWTSEKKYWLHSKPQDLITSARFLCFLNLTRPIKGWLVLHHINLEIQLARYTLGYTVAPY